MKVALDFIASEHKTWGAYCVANKLGYAGATPAAWSVKLRWSSIKGLLGRGLIEERAGRYVVVS